MDDPGAGRIRDPLATTSGDVSGVYSVGVPEEFRRRGIGATVTWAAVRAGREWGCHRRMGFEVLTHYVILR